MFNKISIVVRLQDNRFIIFPGDLDSKSDIISKYIGGEGFRSLATQVDRDVNTQGLSPDDEFVDELLQEKGEIITEKMSKGEKKISKIDVFGCYSVQVLSEIIAKETGVPPFRQCLLLDNEVITHEIHHMSETKYEYKYAVESRDMMLDLPIDIDLVENRNDYVVFGKERSTFVASLFTQAVSVLDMIDLQDVFIPRKLSEYEHENIFFGFVRKFWPMSEVIFMTYCNIEVKILDVYPNIYDYQNKDFQSRAKYFSSIATSIPISELVKFMEITVYSDVSINSKTMFNLVRTDKNLPMVRISFKNRNRNLLLTKVYQFSEFNYLFSTYKSDLAIKHNELILIYVSKNVFTITFTNRYYSIRVYDVPSEKKVYKKIIELNSFIDEINNYDYLLFDNEKRYNMATNHNMIITDMSAILNISDSNASKNISGFMSRLTSCGFFKDFVIEPTRIVCKFEIDYNTDIMAYLQKLGALTDGKGSYYDFMSNVDVSEIFSVYYPTSYEVVFHVESNLVIHLNRINPSIKTILMRVVLNIILEIEKGTRISENIGRGTSLKYKDPDLFVLSRFSDVYRYARVCQKPFQPIAVSELEWSQLDKKTQEQYVKYWNFTHNIPMYYKCPNKNIPYLGFIVDKHPKGYCLPCCQKKVHVENSKKKKIFDKCLKDYNFISEKEESGKFKRYILNYDRDKFELGRMFSLPSLLNDNIMKFNINFASKKERIIIDGDVIFLDNLLSTTAQIKLKSMNVKKLEGELEKIVPGKIFSYKQLLEKPELSNNVFSIIKTSEKPVFLDANNNVIYGIETICRAVLEGKDFVDYKKVRNKFLKQAKKIENNVNYYVYIVQQTFGMLNIGSLYCMSVILSIDPKDLVGQIISALGVDVSTWIGLLDLYSYKYQNIKSLIIDFLYDMEHEMIAKTLVDWNPMIFYCCKQMFNVSLIILEYTRGNCAINLENFNPDFEKVGIIISDNGYYPVVFTSSKNFLNNMVKVIYDKSDLIYIYISEIIDMVKKDKLNITVNIFKEYVKEIFMINKTTIFMIKMKVGEHDFYIPTEYSEIISTTDIQSVIGFPRRSLIKYNYGDFINFTEFYNKTIDEYTKTKGLILGTKGVVPIKPEKIILYKGQAIGVKSSSFYYYFKPDDIEIVSKTFGIDDFIYLLYDPDDLNDLMINNTFATLDQKEYKSALYKKNIGILASMEMLDHVKKSGDLEKIMKEKDVDKIENEIRRLSEKIFEITSPDFEEQYKIVRCKVSKSIFCKNKKVVLDPEMLSDFVRGFVKDIMNPLKRTMLENDYAIYNVFSKMEIQKMADEIIYVKID